MHKTSMALTLFIVMTCFAHAEETIEQPGNPLEGMIAGDDRAKPAATPAAVDWSKQGFIVPPPLPVGGVYDDTLPKHPEELTVKPYEGERYTAQVPATIDLAEYADRSVNFLSRLISPEATDYCVYHFVHLNVNPPILEVGHMSTLAQNAKWSEAIVLMRAMSGNNERLLEDRKLIGSLVRITGRDGLCYHPVAGRPWAYIDPITRNENTPYADLFCEGRQLRAYALWYTHDQNPLWKQLADRKVDRLASLAWREKKSGKRMFRRTRGFSPEYEETGKHKIVAMGDAGGIYEEMTGDGAANAICWPLHALVTWDYLTNSQPAGELADDLARYLYEDKGFYDAQHRDFPSIEHGHPTIFSHTIDGMCSYAVTMQNQGMLNWVIEAYERWNDLRNPERVGIVQSVEGCQIADMIQVGCMLSRTGAADYWEDVDKLLRNNLAAMQIEPYDLEVLKKQPITRPGDPATNKTLKCYAWGIGGDIPLNQPLPPFLHQPADAMERCLGAWFVAVDLRGNSGSIGCCNGNICRGLYMAWDSILEEKLGGLWVNLHLNRASHWADLDSYLPYEGKIALQMKTAQPKVLVRIPQWTDWNEVRCTVNGRSRDYTWLAAPRGYINLGKVKKGDEIIVEFPMKEWVVKTELTVLPAIDASKRKKCDVTLRGNMATSISESVGYPQHVLERNRGDQASMKTVQRFVSDEHFFWYKQP